MEQQIQPVYILPIQSEQTDLISLALSKAQAEFPLIRRSKRANYGEYADTHDILHAVRPILNKYELALNIGKTLHPVTFQELLFVRLEHKGQWYKSYTTMRDNLQKDAEWGACSTFRSRYLYKEILGLSIPDDADDNDDGHAVVTQEELNYLLSLPQSFQLQIKTRNNIQDLADLPRNQYNAIVGYIKKQEEKKRSMNGN